MADETKPPEPAPEGETAPADAAVEDLPPPAIDLSDYDIKPDMFDGVHVLEDNFEKIDGAPNFRQLKGFPIFGTGQPTEAAMVEIINKAKEGAAREGVKVLIIIFPYGFMYYCCQGVLVHDEAGADCLCQWCPLCPETPGETVSNF